MDEIVIEGRILRGGPNHLTDVDGKPVVIDLSAASDRRAMIESLAAYVEAVHPPLLIEHKRDGLRRGEVVDVLEGEGDDGPDVRVRVRVDDPQLAQVANLARRFSPYLLTGATTAAGERYPYGLAEVSAVSVPMVDHGTPDARIAAASAYGAGETPRNVDVSGETLTVSSQPVSSGSDAEAGSPANGDESMMATIAELIAMLQAATPEDLAMLRAVLAEPAPAPAPEVEVDAAALPAPDAPPAAPMDEPIAQIAAAAVAKALKPFEAKIDRLLAVAPTEQPGAIAAAAVARGGVAGGVATPAKSDILARALAIQREKRIPYSEAVSLAHAEG
jgi:hypothetical protein